MGMQILLSIGLGTDQLELFLLLELVIEIDLRSLSPLEVDSTLLLIQISPENSRVFIIFHNDRANLPTSSRDVIPPVALVPSTPSAFRGLLLLVPCNFFKHRAKGCIDAETMSSIDS